MREPCMICGRHRAQSDSTPSACSACRSYALVLHLLKVPGEWVEEAVCAQCDPEVWFPVRGQGAPQATDRALRICGECPVRDECLQYALETEQLHGVWGGTTARERKQMKKEAGAA